MAAFARFLQSPQLLHAVYQLSNRQTQFKLLRVNRSFFNAGAAIIWERVEGIHNLLTLLPGVQCTSDKENPLAKTIVSRYLKHTHVCRNLTQIKVIPRGTLVLGRFQLYASSVKHLSIYNDGIEECLISNWRAFMTCATRNMLLPNLETLKLGAPSNGSDHLFWIGAFLSPSLVHIEVTQSKTSVPLVSYLSASTLLRRIVLSCPKIKVLGLYPESKTASGTDPDMYDEQTLTDFWDGSLAEHLKHLGSLNKLGCTTEILSPDCLVQLGSLPNLEHLVIYPLATPLGTVGPVSTSDFAALRQFDLCSAMPTQFDDIWRLKIFDNLTSIELGFITRPANEHDHRVWATCMLSLIATNSPRLEDLLVDFDIHVDQEEVFDLGAITALTPLKTLPLRELYLHEVTLGTRPSAKYFNGLKRFLENVVILELPNQRCTSREICGFAKLPHLEFLLVDLGLRTPHDEDQKLQITNSNFRVLKSNFGVDIVGDVHKIAQYTFRFTSLQATYVSVLCRRLLSLWPRLRRVEWDAENEREGDMEPDVADTMATALTSAISLLRELRNTKQRIHRTNPEALKHFSQNL